MEISETARYALQAATALVLVAGVAWVIIRKKNGIAAASFANSESIKSTIRALGPEYQLHSDVMVPTRYGMGRIDHVVVSPYGIFVVTVKKQAGRIEGRESDAEWDIKTREGWDTIANPQWENRKLMNHLEAHIGSYYFIPVVLFTRAKLKGRYAKNVLPAKRLSGYILEHKRPVLKEEDLTTLLEKLKRLPGQKPVSDGGAG